MVEEERRGEVEQWFHFSDDNEEDSIQSFSGHPPITVAGTLPTDEALSLLKKIDCQTGNIAGNIVEIMKNFKLKDHKSEEAGSQPPSLYVLFMYIYLLLYK